MRIPALALLLVGAAAVAEAQPPQARAAFDKGRALLQQKDHIQAVIAFREAVRDDPNFVDALNDLAWVQATSDDPSVRSPREAVGHAERALDNVIKAWVRRRIDPPADKTKLNPGYIARLGTTLAAAYAADGKFQPAVPPEVLTKVQRATGSPVGMNSAMAESLQSAAVPYAEWALSIAVNENKKRASPENARLVQQIQGHLKSFRSRRALAGRLPPP